MTVSTTENRTVYKGNGSTTVFSTSFEFLEDSDLVVTHIVRDADEVVTAQNVLTLGSDYTVSGGDGSTGSVTLTSVTPDSTDLLVLERNVAYTQGIDYVPNDPFPAEVAEQGYDRLTYLVQQVLDLAQRAIRLDITSDAAENLSEDREDKLIYFNDDGQPKLTSFTETQLSAAVAAAIDSGTLVADRTYTGDGTTTTFDLGIEPPNVNAVLAVIDGVVQNPDDFSVSGTDVIFDTAPPNGSDINLRNFGYAKAIETAAASSVQYDTDYVGAPNTNLRNYLDAQSLPTKADLKAIAAADGPGFRRVVTLARSVSGDDGGGEWVWDGSDRSSDVANDPQEIALVVPDDAASDGSDGAWVRQFSGAINAAWAGVRFGNTTAIQSANVTALQAALDLANTFASSSSWQHVYLPSGIYRVNGGLLFNGNNIGIYGDGPRRTQILSEATSGILFQPGDATTKTTQITIRDMTLDGQELGMTQGVYMPSCNQWRMSNVWIDGFTSYQLQIYGQREADGTISASKPGDSTYNTFEDCVFLNGAANYAVALRGTAGNTRLQNGTCNINEFRGCHFTNNAGGGLLIDSGAANIVVRGSFDANQGRGLYIRWYGNTIIGGVAETTGGSPGDGIAVSGDPEAHDNFIVGAHDGGGHSGDFFVDGNGNNYISITNSGTKFIKADTPTKRDQLGRYHLYRNGDDWPAFKDQAARHHNVLGDPITVSGTESSVGAGSFARLFAGTLPATATLVVFQAASGNGVGGVSADLNIEVENETDGVTEYSTNGALQKGQPLAAVSGLGGKRISVRLVNDSGSSSSMSGLLTFSILDL